MPINVSLRFCDAITIGDVWKTVSKSIETTEANDASFKIDISLNRCCHESLTPNDSFPATINRCPR